MTFGQPAAEFGATDGMFGSIVPPVPVVPINILHEDGTVTEGNFDVPNAWLPDGTGFRVRVRFVQADEGLPTYRGLKGYAATYTAVIDGFADYQAIVASTVLGIDVDYDITCFVAGTSIQSGRNGLFDVLDAATAKVTLIDRLNLFDPRWEDTLLGPGRRVRSGTWIRIEIWRHPDIGWVPMFTGLTDAWRRTIRPDETATVDIDATDFQQGLASAHVSGVLTARTVSQRIQDLLFDFWQATWGNTEVAAATLPLYGQTIEDDTALALMDAAAHVADGRIYVNAAGDFIFENHTWRNSRNVKVVFLGRGAIAFLEGTTSVCTYATIAGTWGSYNTVRDGFLIYDDMHICANASPLATVCGTAFDSADSAEDVINEVILGYEPAGGGAVVNYAATDTASIRRYGKRGYRRDDLTPTAGTILMSLASTLLARWKSGDATVTACAVDLLRDRAPDILFTLKSGDLIVAVDEIPAAVSGTGAVRYDVATSEIMNVDWSVGPNQLVLALTLDQQRVGAASEPTPELGAMSYDSPDRTATGTEPRPADPAAAV